MGRNEAHIADTGDFETIAAGYAGDYISFGDDWTAGVAIPESVIRYHLIPHHVTSTSIKCDNVRISSRVENLVFENSDRSRFAPRRRHSIVGSGIFPNQTPCCGVARLNSANNVAFTRVDYIDDSAVH